MIGKTARKPTRYRLEKTMILSLGRQKTGLEDLSHKTAIKYQL
jgi:hypothetical protein